MTERAAVLALFESRGAASIDHPGGTLLDHLVRVADRLERWGAAHDLVIAGLAHAAYGTDGFDAAPFQLTERELVASVTGQRAEAIVYSYASCDRAYTLGQIGRQQTVSLRDRFTGARTVLTSSELHEFAELTFANELDLVQHSEEFRRDLGAAIAEMFARWSHVVSDAAYEDFGRTLGDAPTAPDP